MRGAPAQSPPSSMNNGTSMNGNGHSVNRESSRSPTKQPSPMTNRSPSRQSSPMSSKSPTKQSSPMSSMVTAGCEECQRLLMELMAHMQQNHSQAPNQGASQGATARNLGDVTSPVFVNGRDVPYNGPSRIPRSDHEQNQQQVDSLPATRGRTPTERGRTPTERGQTQSFQQSPSGSAFSKPSPTKNKNPDVNKPVPVPMSKEQDSQNNKGASSVAVSPGGRRETAEQKKAECDLKPCEACEKPGMFNFTWYYHSRQSG